MSEIRVDTISEKTSANGVAIDGLTIKDGGISATTGVVVFSDANTRLRLMESDTTDVNTQLQNQGGDFIIATVNDAGDSATERLIIDHATGRVGIGTTPDLGAGLHIRVSDSGGTVNGNYDTLVIEESGHSGIEILSGTSSTGLIGFGDSGAALRGYVAYSHTNDQFEIATAATEQVRIHSNGVVSANSGVALGVGTANTASNVLDDYEEGTYTPTVDDENGGSYGLASGGDLLQYTKIGRKVTLQGMISVTSESSPNGTLRLSLPFAAPSLTDDTDYALYAMGISNNGSTIAGQKFLFVQPGSYAFLYAIGDDGATNYIGHDEVDTNFQFHVNLSYVVS
jgi:hypothetical protein